MLDLVEVRQRRPFIFPHLQPQGPCLHGCRTLIPWYPPLGSCGPSSLHRQLASMRSGLHLSSTASALALRWYPALLTACRTSSPLHPLMRSSSPGCAPPFSIKTFCHADAFPLSLCAHFRSMSFLSLPSPSMSRPSAAASFWCFSFSFSALSSSAASVLSAFHLFTFPSGCSGSLHVGPAIHRISGFPS